jgi:3-methyladenine DNA glycosylase/8-oxoguanine DNA glycosylase
MAETLIQIQAAAPFDFWSTLQAHGWVDLLPNIYHEDTRSFSRVERLASGKVVRLHVSAGKQEGDSVPLTVQVSHAGRLAAADREEVESAARHMLRLDEDFSEFYRLCKQNGLPWSRIKPGKGRLLRSPGLFEDMVKVILTTNVQWGGTRRMVRELVEQFGEPFPSDSALKAFPQAQAMAALPFEDFQSRVRLGYRAAYIYQLACVFSQKPDCYAKFIDMEIPSAEIKKDLLAIKGIGNYAAASILMLLGRYDEIPVDSVFQQLMEKKYFPDRDFELKEALAIYEKWGRWQYLAYWFDLLTFHQMLEVDSSV